MPRLSPSTHVDRRPPAVPAVVDLDGVHVRLGDHHALRGVDLRVDAAELTVLTGPNGAGKSTLLDVVAGLRPPSSGQVRRAAGSVAFVPQRTAVPDQLPVTVRDVVTLGIWGEVGAWRPVGPAGRRRVQEALEVLDLLGLARRSFAALSGGERQRALLAQGLARRADLLLVDEPTTGLDTLSTSRIVEALQGEVGRGAAVVCVSHDPVVIARADRAVALEEGRVVEDTTTPGRRTGRAVSCGCADELAAT